MTVAQKPSLFISRFLAEALQAQFTLTELQNEEGEPRVIEGTISGIIETEPLFNYVTEQLDGSDTCINIAKQTTDEIKQLMTAFAPTRTLFVYWHED